MAKDLIDPMNMDTYDDRAIVYGPIKSKPPNDSYRKGWDRIFNKKFTIKIKKRKLCLRVNLHESF